MKRLISLVLILSLMLTTPFVLFAEEKEVIIIKPIVILMDYQDYTHDQLAEKEEYAHVTGDSFKSYEKDLYEKLFFGEGTYKGPDNKEYITFREYFKQLSHNTYLAEGDVFGWYKASMNASEYGSDKNESGSEQDEAKVLVEEALTFVSNEENINLDIYDRMDPNDIDNDGDIYEPDGEIDIVIVVHAGSGEEWGGGSLGEDAIWPFRIGFDWYSDGEKYEVNYGEKSILANDFLIIEQDFPMALACHEYSHYLGLPDLYNYSGTSPIYSWSNMSGSYCGEIPGATPPILGAYGREILDESILNEAVDKNIINFEMINDSGLNITLSAAADENNKFDNLIRLDLPEKETIVVVPPTGDKVYYSNTGNFVNNDMSINIDLTNGSSSELSFKTWYDIDPEWDYASVQVKEEGTDLWIPVEGNITTTENPNDDTPSDSTDRNPGHGITLDSGNKWIDATFDLSEFTGSKVDLKFMFWTDSNTPEAGIYLDDIKVTLDDATILEDSAESESSFVLDGFSIDTGKLLADHYYLIEYRDHKGLDEALLRTYYRHPESAFNEGLVIWYIDETYTEDGDINQDNSSHPGSLSVGVIDAGQSPVIWRTTGTDERNIDKVNYQMHDAAFSLKQEPQYLLNWGTVETIDEELTMQSVFSDKNDYSNVEITEAGLLLNDYGLNIFILEENSSDRTMNINIQRENISTFASEYSLENIIVEENNISVSFDNNDLNKFAYAVYLGDIPTLDQKLVRLELKNDKFEGSIDSVGENYELAYIIIEDANNISYAFYNSQVYNGYGIDFSNLSPSDTNEYIIKENDTLQKIAKRFNTNLGQLKKLNDISNPNRIYIGQKILVPNN